MADELEENTYKITIPEETRKFANRFQQQPGNDSFGYISGGKSSGRRKVGTLHRFATEVGIDESSPMSSKK